MRWVCKKGYFIILVIAILMTVGCLPKRVIQPPSKVTEGRGIWVIAYQIASPDNIRKIVETAKENNFNMLFVQIVVGGYAYYNSDILPRSENLTDSLFDPLKDIIEEAHKKGLEVHAWINTYIVWSREALPKASKHILYQHPDWFLIDDNGKSMAEYTKDDMIWHRVEGMYLDAGKKEVKDWIYNIFMEVTRNYDVDGVHFDFVRYPVGLFFPRKSDYPVDPLMISRNAHYYEPSSLVKRDGSILDRWNMYHFIMWNEERSESIKELVEMVVEGIEKEKPEVIVSAAVFPDPGTAYKWCGQRWRKWPLDITIPMAYGGNLEYVGKLMASYLTTNKCVYTGLGAYLKTSDEIIKEIKLGRGLDIDGFVLFMGKPCFEEKKYLSRIKSKLFSIPALVPRFPREPERVDKSKKENRWIKNIEDSFTSTSEFFKCLRDNGKTYNDFLKEQADEVNLIEKINNEVYKETKIEDSEIVLSPKLVRYSSIYVSIPSSFWGKIKAFSKVTLVRTALKLHSFPTVARRYSENSKKPLGGDCGFTTLDKDDQITKALDEMEENELREIRTSLGIIFLKVDKIIQPHLVEYGKLDLNSKRVVFQRELERRIEEWSHQ
ncbi:MAG: hypothetical protein COT45_04050 [bacterium (Candidatus Stahlbacteria) CG08_land_8_20_14_0_20_40_26]|nr:MAG: hypothetical protein COX49_08870 [bacterium (Candidatus Stahlbacteria) CG23_combo_of_CG06-09_8_20_14_all_40_9]PIS24582.1 MAG: hypothetical protein COT45_04050 [bacterium (Candidatus Stahlbacteria) CG08_land_8_20_14_0_20_40_26]